MNYRLSLLFVLLVAFSGVLADESDGPRTGYFRVSATTVELLGADGANVIAEVLAPDEELKWQLYVPPSYDAAKPAGAIVFINRSDSWGGSSKSYNPVLEESNLIWAAPLGAGDKQPMNERMLRAMLTPNLLARTYALDPSRIYIGGFVGGGYVATMLATSKPEVFRGGMFVGGALPWEKNTPPAIAQIRKNRYAFVTGSNDVALDTMRRTTEAYRKEGVVYVKLIVIPNARQEMPDPFYLREAIEFLDGD
jgi:predicted peptidase